MTRDHFDPTEIAGEHHRIRWVPETDDLHANVVDLRAREEIAVHINHALDVLIIGLGGEGILTIAGQERRLSPGSVTLVRKGDARGIIAGDHGVIYATVHARRGGILPTVSR